MFRVKAVNDEGDSEPLETEAAIKAKDPYGKDSKRKEKYPTAVQINMAKGCVNINRGSRNLIWTVG